MPYLDIKTVIAALKAQPAASKHVDCFAVVAATWILTDGRMIFGALHDSAATADDGERVYVARAGTHPGQWRLWKQQPSQLRHDVERRDTARVVLDAVYSMDVIERQMAL